MGKNNFYSLENQFLHAGIATSEFQTFQQSSGKNTHSTTQKTGFY